MGGKFKRISDVEFQQAVKLIRKYLKDNGCIEKPFHYSRYLIQDAKIGDYLMSVRNEFSKTILQNKLYKIVSGYSEFNIVENPRKKNKRILINRKTTWVITDENGCDYEVETTNNYYRWAYFDEADVEKKYTDGIPEHIVEYNKRISKSMDKAKKKKYSFLYRT